MEELELTPKDKYTIAEYIFSYKTDVLIKSDAKALIDTLLDLDIINSDQHTSFSSKISEGNAVVSTNLMVLLKVNIPDKQLDQIMKEYYGQS